MSIKHKHNYEDAYVRATPKHSWRGITKDGLDDLSSEINRHCDVSDLEIVYESQWETEDGKVFDTKAEAIIHELNHPDFDTSDAYSPTFDITYKSFSDSVETHGYPKLFSEVIEEDYRSPVNFRINDKYLLPEQIKLIDEIILFSCKQNIEKVTEFYNKGKISNWFVEKYEIDVLCTTHDFNI
jgi:hypothetical protein